ncbi:MAG: hypothetical protein UE783_06015 [Prevotella sp.]|nr:hypothetical protein [Prevotella sp.]
MDCKKARQLAERLEGEIMETALLADNKAYAEFAKRALANGYRKVLVLCWRCGRSVDTTARQWQHKSSMDTMPMAA